MAKRTVGESPYSPLDTVLTQSVINASQSVGRADLPNSVAPIGQEQKAFPLERAASFPTSARNSAREASAAMSARTLCREKRVLMTIDEERLAERLVDRLGEQLRTSLKLSHLLRACIAVLCNAEQELVRRAAESSPLSRPGNDNALALAHFEQAVARMVSRALRDAPLLR